LLKRVATAVIGIPVLIFLVYTGGVVLQSALTVLSIIGLFEFYGTMSDNRSNEFPTIENKAGFLRIKGTLTVHFIGYIFTVVYYFLLSYMNNTSYFFVLITVFITSVLTYMVIFHTKVDIIDCIVTLFGFFYVAFPFSFIYLVRMNTRGAFLVWLVFICAFGSDTFAYLIGKSFGRHKLVGALSPNKTVEGALGGVTGASVLALAYGFVVARFFKISDINFIFYSMAVGGAGAVFSIFGDLSASAIKRYKKIKDFGNLFPGHGGVLDRFDSVIFTAPVVYVVLTVLTWAT